jgi:thioester reductase-like protein
VTDHVLVTGATGFLGAFVVDELLKQTDATVYCLVRGRSGTGGEQRLRANLDKLKLAGIDHSRVICVHGNMRRSELGVAPAEHERLATDVSAVYHCAASVNLAAPYVRLAPTNVVGTNSMLAFAETSGATLHFVSSLAIFMDAHLGGFQDVDEDTVPTAEAAAPIGYAQTKFVAEDLIRTSGLPYAIYRPGFIVGDSRTGASSATDAMVRAIRAAVALRSAPDTTGLMPAAPVDFVARAIVALSQQPDALQTAHHLIQAEPLPMHHVFEAGRAAGHPMDIVSCANWKQTLQAHLDSPDAYVMSALWDFAQYMLATDPRHRIARIRADRTLAHLATLGIHPGQVDHRAITAVYTHLTETALLPQPVPDLAT